MQLRNSLVFASVAHAEPGAFKRVSVGRNRILSRKALLAATLWMLVFQTGLAGDAPAVRVHGFIFKTPLGWTVIGRPPGEDVARVTVDEGRGTAELLFGQHGYGGQSAVGDAEFWFSEFSGSASTRYLESERFGSVKITFATTRGTFTPDSSVKKIAPREGYALCGAILEGKSGVAYVRMVGPAEVVNGLTAAFKSMIYDAAKTEMAKPRPKPK